MTNTNGYLKIKGMSPQLLVADLHRSIDFYTKKLGFEIGFLHEDFYAGITKDSFSIHLKSGSPYSEERATRRTNEDLDLTFSVAGIEELYEDLQSKSVEFTQSLRDMPYGRECYISDPDGYILAFVEEKP
jgi:catechol 2,3-dioxygenase-like lactoylglutathione lyase family enzyme